MTSNDRLIVAPPYALRRLAVTALLLVLGVSGAAGAQQRLGQTAQPLPSATAAGLRGAPQQAGRSGVDGRVQLLARELNLDAGQQVELRKILLQQNAEVRRVWGEESVPAPVRVATTRAIGDKTGDRIRALLSPEQKKKYNQPSPQHPTATDSSGSSVEDWIRAANRGGSVQPPSGATGAK